MTSETPEGPVADPAAPTSTPTGNGAERRVRAAARAIGRDVRDGVGRARSLTQDLLRSPELRRLRWILLVGLLIRLVLAPITAWGVDTTYFGLSDLNLLYTGNPYRAGTLFNPPLGALLQLPGVAVLSRFLSPASLVAYAPALVGPTTTTGMFVPYLPSPAMLLALKLPLIAADVGVAVLLFRLLRGPTGERFAAVGAAAWFLNPLVIWSSSVHGEVDALAALAVVGFLYAWKHDRPFAAGAALALGTAAKLYPVLLVPLALVLFSRRAGAPRGSLGRFGLGAAVASLPFLPFVVLSLGAVTTHAAGNTAFGGVSLWILLNPILFTPSASVPLWGDALAVDLAEGLLAVIVALSVYAVWRRPPAPDSDRAEALPRLSLLVAAVVAGALVALVVPQAENLIGLLPPVLLATGALRARTSVGLAAGIGASGWAQYLSLLGPLAFFYPLAQLLGPRAVAFVSRPTIAYGTGAAWISQGPLWLAFGCLAGALTLGVWALGVRTALGSEPPGATPSPGPSAERGSSVSRRRFMAQSGVRLASCASLALAVLLVVTGAASLAATAPLDKPLFQATLVEFESAGGAASAKVLVHVGSVPMDAQLALVPAVRWPTGPIYFFADANYPAPYATYTQTYEVETRVASALASSGVVNPPQLVDGAQIAGVLARPGPATLVVVGGLLPDAVLSGAGSPVERWIAQGGTLVWAGGPLGFAEGHPVPGGTFYWDPLLWNGQIDLVGFPLTDPDSNSPLSAASPSPIASAMALEYNGTPSGANVSEVDRYGGTVLGWTTGPLPGGEASKTSLASVPVGAGRILFFGGAISAATRPQQYVPLAAFTLSGDIAALLETSLAPLGADAASTSASLLPGSSHIVTVSGNFPTPALLLLTAPSWPIYFGVFAAYLPASSSSGISVILRPAGSPDGGGGS